MKHFIFATALFASLNVNAANLPCSIRPKKGPGGFRASGTCQGFSSSRGIYCVEVR